MNSYELISKYRKFLMGIAVIWLLLFHSAFTFSGRQYYAPLEYLFKNIGYICVDFFLFLSGFGLYHALSRNPDPIRFLNRRARRLLPSYLPAIFIFVVWYSLLGECTLADAIGNFTCTGWWANIQGSMLNWFPQVIWVFYLLAPYIAAPIRTSSKPALAAGLLIAFSVLAAVPFFGVQNGLYMMGLARFPIYILGFLFGRKRADGHTISLPARLGLYVVSLGGLAFVQGFMHLFGGESQALLWRYGLWYYPMFFAVPGLCLLLSRLAAFAERCFLRYPVRWVTALGDYSFELMLLQLLVYNYFNRHCTDPSTLEICAVMMFTVAAGLAYGYGVRKLTARLWPDQPRPLREA